MRYTTRAMLGMLLAVVMGTAGFAEETKAPWWHFGTGKADAEAPPSMTAAPTLTPPQTLTPPSEASSTFARPSAAQTMTAGSKWQFLPGRNRPADRSVTSEVTPDLAETRPARNRRRTLASRLSMRSRPRNTWAPTGRPTTTAAARVGPGNR